MITIIKQGGTSKTKFIDEAERLLKQEIRTDELEFSTYCLKQDDPNLYYHTGMQTPDMVRATILQLYDLQTVDECIIIGREEKVSDEEIPRPIVVGESMDSDLMWGETELETVLFPLEKIPNFSKLKKGKKEQISYDLKEFLNILKSHNLCGEETGMFHGNIKPITYELIIEANLRADLKFNHLMVIPEAIDRQTRIAVPYAQEWEQIRDKTLPISKTVLTYIKTKAVQDEVCPECNGSGWYSHGYEYVAYYDLDAEVCKG